MIDETDDEMRKHAEDKARERIEFLKQQELWAEGARIDQLEREKFVAQRSLNADELET